MAYLKIGDLEGRIVEYLASPIIPLHRPPSRHPDVERDLAVVVATDCPAASVAAAIVMHGGDLLRSVTLFDSYRGKPLAEDEVSLAYRLVFAAQDRTLTEHEVATAVDAITAGLGTAVGGRIRA